MRAALIPIFAAACGASSTSEGTGTVAYLDEPSGNLTLVDVATGVQTALDTGSLTAVSIAPDGQHVAYMDFQDGMMRIADRSGAVSILSSSCGQSAIWMSSDTLLYCASDNTTILVTLGVSSRSLAAESFWIAWTSDTAQLVYVHSDLTMGPTFGDLVVENRDGSGQRVLLPNANVQTIAITPDQQHVVAVVTADTGASELHAIALDGSGDVDLGLVASLASSIPNASRFSPSGTEVLAVDESGLFAADLATGAHRSISHEANRSGMPAGFLDAARTIREPGAAIAISGGTKDVALESSAGSSQCAVVDVAIDAEIAAVECTIPAIIDFDGNTITGHIAQITLGLSADRGGMVTVGTDGELEYTRLDGSSKTLGVTMSNGNIGTFLSDVPAAPRVFAAYAP